MKKTPASAVTLTDFDVSVGDRTLRCVLSEPAQLAEQPAVLLHHDPAPEHLSGESPSYGLTCKAFLASGHRVVGYELPNHGSRIGDWPRQEIGGMCDAFVAGSDPFAMVVQDGRAMVDTIIERGWAPANHIFIAGCSRGGYCALRMMAGDSRIRAGQMDAPVTDWRALTEFADFRDREDVAGLALKHYVADLVGRPIWTGIGNCDNRVSTACYWEFCLAMGGEQEKRGMTESRFVSQVVEAPGHGFPVQAREQGAAWLVKLANEPVLEVGDKSRNRTDQPEGVHE